MGGHTQDTENSMEMSENVSTLVSSSQAELPPFRAHVSVSVQLTAHTFR